MKFFHTCLLLVSLCFAACMIEEDATQDSLLDAKLSSSSVLSSEEFSSSTDTLKVCPAIGILCQENETVIDSDGDSCSDSCAPIEIGCPEIYSPVCVLLPDMSEKTLSNKCEAEQKGLKIVSEGECGSTTSMCILPDGSSIKAGETTKLECNTCVCTPEGGLACTKMACIEEPLCESPEEACVAITVKEDIQCITTPCVSPTLTSYEIQKVCPNQNVERVDPSFCSLDPGICTTEYVPVCGLDKTTGAYKTFGNSCELSNAKGFTLAYDGECKPIDTGVCEPGKIYPAGDGCNTCGCTADGQLMCTLMACQL